MTRHRNLDMCLTSRQLAEKLPILGTKDKFHHPVSRLKLA